MDESQFDQSYDEHDDDSHEQDHVDSHNQSAMVVPSAPPPVAKRGYSQQDSGPLPTPKRADRRRSLPLLAGAARPNDAEPDLEGLEPDGQGQLLLDEAHTEQRLAASQRLSAQAPVD